MKNILAVVLLSGALAACGGGSSSGGGFAVSEAYVGNYTGTTTTILTGPGGTVSTQRSGVFSVSGNGHIQYVEGSQGAPSCVPLAPTGLQGNGFGFSQTYVCPISGLGSCTFHREINGMLTPTTAHITNVGYVQCPGLPRVYFNSSFRGTKSKTRSLSNAERQELTRAFANDVRRAAGK